MPFANFKLYRKLNTQRVFITNECSPKYAVTVHTERHCSRDDLWHFRRFVLPLDLHFGRRSERPSVCRHIHSIVCGAAIHRSPAWAAKTKNNGIEKKNWIITKKKIIRLVFWVKVLKKRWLPLVGWFFVICVHHSVHAKKQINDHNIGVFYFCTNIFDPAMMIFFNFNLKCNY